MTGNYHCIVPLLCDINSTHFILNFHQILEILLVFPFTDENLWIKQIMLSKFTVLIYVRAIIITHVSECLSLILSARLCYLNWVQLIRHFLQKMAATDSQKGKTIFIFFSIPKEQTTENLSKFNKVEIILFFIF